jgi:hypothetical protein
MRFNAFLLAAALISSPVIAAEPAPDWSALAIGDVEAAYKETVENHPGMFDPANPGFAKLLEMARAEGLKLARQAKTGAAFEASLERFRAVLNDGHAGAYANLPEQYRPQIRWPGFVAAWRGDAMYVYKSAEGGPASGAEITSCDGQPIRKLAEAKVFGFATGKNVPGEWWSSARRVLIDDGNPFVKLPKKCAFKSNGKSETRTLSWSPIPDYYQQWRNGSINGDLLPIGMAERAPGIHWIALPDFQPDDAGVASYKKLYADVEAARPALLSAKAVVLDLRYNNGGSSNWSKMLAKKLWGEAQVNAALKSYFSKTQTWWRPTKGNLEAVKEFVTLLETQGDTDTANLVRMFIPMFETSIAQGEKFLVEPDFPTQGDDSTTQSDFTTPVYVVVPGQCASACLDAIDYFKRFPNTKLIGAPSSADSTYMEVRNPKLPSGMASAIIPMKMYVDRPRGNGVYYPPDIEMRDFDWSTEHFLKKIKADLAVKR